ncbi:hypothetical protein [Parapedobacter sp. DT-150]|uniref:hypothetical protein n=1 Tax=Parapedobacter sp. DT-150 TaxID=3396162 RepID=UPI003F1B8E08
MEMDKAIARNRLLLTPAERILRWAYLALLFSASLTFLYLLVYTDWYEKKAISGDVMPEIAIYILALFMLILGVYAIVKWKKLAEWTVIPSSIDEMKKKALLDKLALSYNWRLEQDSTENCYRYFFGKRFFGSSHRITVLVAADFFYINVLDYYNPLAAIDFGTNKRLKNKIKAEIEGELTKMSVSDGLTLSK